MEKFEKQSMPKACKNLEKFLEKNPKDEVYCVGNKVSYFGILFYDEENYYNFVFQHAVFCHVCHCSLCVISY